MGTTTSSTSARYTATARCPSGRTLSATTKRIVRWYLHRRESLRMEPTYTIGATSIEKDTAVKYLMLSN